MLVHSVCAGSGDSFLIEQTMTWYKAQSYCRENYTDLVSIRNEGQKEEVKNEGMNSTTPYWIGLLYDDWEWSDGGRSSYRNWSNVTYSYYPKAGENHTALYPTELGIITVGNVGHEDYTLCSEGKLPKRNIVKLLLICMKDCYSVLIIAWSRGLNSALPFYSLHLSSQTQCKLTCDHAGSTRL